jgi:hypothetical protein
MRPQFQFASCARAASAIARGALAGFLLAAFLICAAIGRADDAPSGAVGRVEGKDISVEGGVGGSGQPTVAPSIYVSNGSVVTVHSGKARMTLFAGGKIEICGPAKFTVLLSGSAVTLALNFGRVRAELPAKTALRIFTPTIVGTPIEISGGTRDVTVGLNLDDSLCVQATSGAIQLEQQFTGEKLIVPEAGEFFLNSGKLLPVAGMPGSCQCFADEQREVPPPSPTIPEFAAVAPSQAAANSARAETEPGIEYSVLERANQGHPLVASARSEPAAVPPAPTLGEVVPLPALTFLAGSTVIPPPGPSEEIMLLIREARVSPDWQFTGRVEPPEFAAAMQHALAENVPPAQKQESTEAQPAEKTKKKKGGFWAAMKRVFGRGEQD